MCPTGSPPAPSPHPSGDRGSRAPVGTGPKAHVPLGVYCVWESAPFLYQSSFIFTSSEVLTVLNSTSAAVNISCTVLGACRYGVGATRRAMAVWGSALLLVVTLAVLEEAVSDDNGECAVLVQTIHN